jgi:hypothetical protein
MYTHVVNPGKRRRPAVTMEGYRRTEGGTPMRLRNLLIVNSIFMLCNGTITVLLPAAQLSLYGATLGPTERLMAQYAGMGSIVIGLLAWLSRNVVDLAARRAVILTLLVSHLIGAALSIAGSLSGVLHAQGWLIAGCYMLFAMGYAFFQFAGHSGRSPASAR